jgi:phage FluMu protein Com
MVNVTVCSEVECPRCKNTFEVEIEQDVDIEPTYNEGCD